MTDQPGSLAAALIQLQAQLPRITKADRAQAGNRVTSYANLNTITEAVFPLLLALGLCWTCQPTMSEGQFVLLYELIHEGSGERIRGYYPLPQNANSQSIGGAITYARRYALCAVLGIAPAEDDDDAAGQAKEAADRQNMRTSRIADERAASPPQSPRLAERLTGRLPDDEWTARP